MVSDLKKKIVISASIMSLISIMIFFIAFKTEFKPLTLGLILGVLIGVLNFWDLALTMERAVVKNPGHAQSYAIRKYFIRYIITGVVIYVAVVSPHLHVVGTVIGMMFIKTSVLVTNLFNDKKFYKEIIKRREV